MATATHVFTNNKISSGVLEIDEIKRKQIARSVGRSRARKRCIPYLPLSKLKTCLRYLVPHLVRCTFAPNANNDNDDDHSIGSRKLLDAWRARLSEFRVFFTTFFVGKPNKHLEFTTRAASACSYRMPSQVFTVYHPLYPYIPMDINRSRKARLIERSIVFSKTISRTISIFSFTQIYQMFSTYQSYFD